MTKGPPVRALPSLPITRDLARQALRYNAPIVKSTAPSLVPLVPLIVALFAAPLEGCKASVSGETRGVGVGSEGSVIIDDDEWTDDMDEPLSASEDDPELSEDPVPSAELAPVGARHDLHLEGPGTNACRCMKVYLGDGSGKALRWDGPAPRIDSAAQLVLSFAGESCEGVAPDVRPSYWGFQVKESDVIVGIENAHEGRPHVTGAILPRPAKGGKVVLRPTEASVPFARGPGGRCELGNPGRTPTSAASGAPVGGVMMPADPSEKP
jgi:hypothetical protein